MTRRLFIAAAPALLAGCVTDGDDPGLRRQSRAAPRASVDPRYEQMYSGFQDGDFYVAAVDLSKISQRLLRQEVAAPAGYASGSIVVDPGAHYLYYVGDNGTAMRYGVGVGRDGFAWNGNADIRRKGVWPTWTPPKEMVERDPNAAPWADGMPGGPENPLGARALYLYQGKRDTLYRLHGTNDPSSIGKSLSSGCVRLLNQDIINLYNRTSVGTKVTVLGSGSSFASNEAGSVPADYEPRQTYGGMDDDRFSDPYDGTPVRRQRGGSAEGSYRVDQGGGWTDSDGY